MRRDGFSIEDWLIVQSHKIESHFSHSREIPNSRWKSAPGGLNFILCSDDDDFYISYNPGNYLVGAYESDDGGPETALCCGGKYYILNGDFRDEYESVFDSGPDACFDVYRKHVDKHGSSWGNRLGADK